MSSFLKRALRLRERGYKIVPIPSGMKRVVLDDWVDLDATKVQIEKWGSGRYHNGNVGILTSETPAIDIDVTDADVAEAMEKWIADKYGDILVRVGKAPKRLILFRTKTPFRKMFASYNDGERTHKLEILGVGQQFVAFGIHPDTNKPYEWTSLESPLDVDMADLPKLTLAGAEEILEAFCEICEEAGWKQVGASKVARDATQGGGLETWKPIATVSEETIDDTLATIPNDGNADYDLWLEVGMALHHQYEGEDIGLQKWHAWSEQNDAYSASTTNYKWDSFGNGPATVTFRSLLHKAKEFRAEAAEEKFRKAMKRVFRCNDKRELTDKVMKEVALACSDELQQDEAIAKIQERLKEITGTKPRLESVRKAFLGFLPKTIEERPFPEWCENWIYIERAGVFYNSADGREMPRSSFDATFGKHLLSDEDRATGVSFNGLASNVALNIHEIPCVYEQLYLPGADSLLKYGGIHYVNTYNASSVPKMREPDSKAEWRSIARAEEHMRLLFPNRRERRLLMDFLAYNVQFPGEKIKWAVLVQGVDGAGKTFFRELMEAVLGAPNVRGVEASALKETFTDWAEGRQMVFLEEIRLHNQNRFEILDKLKPYITNKGAHVRRHFKTGYEIQNVTNYVLFTNYIDALPINNNDRRYFIIRTCFQTESHITKFNDENPDYFKKLFNMLTRDADVLRWWLNEWEISEDFNPKGHAPKTEARLLMMDAADNSDDKDVLEKILRDSDDPLLSERLLSSVKLRDTELGSLPPRTLGALLQRAGFAAVARCRLGGRHDEPATYYTRHSELFVGADPIPQMRALAAGEYD